LGTAIIAALESHGHFLFGQMRFVTSQAVLVHVDFDFLIFALKLQGLKN
jgi:hypothetical protein